MPTPMLQLIIAYVRLDVGRDWHTKGVSRRRKGNLVASALERT